jgi:NADH dehydrogenase [ubiquinone] 1 alpha subcomplex assembly factor 3
MFDGSFLYGPIAVFPNVALSWRVARPENITPESLKLFFMLQPKLDVLVIGVGGRKDIDKVRKQVIEAIHNERIGLELAPTVSPFHHNIIIVNIHPQLIQYLLLGRCCPNF